jgi:hypothetical protein
MIHQYRKKRWRIGADGNYWSRKFIYQLICTQQWIKDSDPNFVMPVTTGRSVTCKECIKIRIACLEREITIMKAKLG